MPSFEQCTSALVNREQALAAPTQPGRRKGSDRQPTERDYAAIREAFRSSGGTVQRDALARVLHGCDGTHNTVLEQAPLPTEGFSFEWRDVLWVPMFQFDLRDMSLKPRPRRVLGELGGVFDGWALALWFSHPNQRLRNRRPVDVLDSDLPSVLAAARADRFTASA